MAITFRLKTLASIGTENITTIVDYIVTENYSRIGLITDQHLINHKSVRQLKDKIATEKNILITTEYIYDLQFEPDYATLDKVKHLFKTDNKPTVDIIIAIGGGSVLDFSKGIATLITNHNEALSYRGFPVGLNMSVPVIAVPTTAGTASEVTYNAVFIDNDGGKKLGINTYNNFPVMAVLDSNLVKDCPYSVALSSGLDALVHIFESFACKQHNIITRMYARQAFALVINNFENSLTNPNDENLSNMQTGAYLAGISLMNSGSGPSGAISYALGVTFKYPHGLAGGITLPYLIEHNLKKGYYDYSILAAEITNKPIFKSDEEACWFLLDYLKSLYARIKVYEYAAKIKVDPNNESLVAYINLMQGGFDQNPKPFTPANAIQILQYIYPS